MPWRRAARAGRSWPNTSTSPNHPPSLRLKPANGWVRESPLAEHLVSKKPKACAFSGGRERLRVRALEETGPGRDARSAPLAEGFGAFPTKRPATSYESVSGSSSRRDGRDAALDVVEGETLIVPEAVYSEYSKVPPTASPGTPTTHQPSRWPWRWAAPRAGVVSGPATAISWDAVSRPGRRTPCSPTCAMPTAAEDRRAGYGVGQIPRPGAYPRANTIK